MENQESLVKKACFWLLSHRLVVLITMGIATAFFAVGHVKNIVVETIFEDLLPQQHPYIKTHLEYVEQLGDPLKVYLMLRVTEGDIYTEETLQKVRRINTDLDLIKGVNHNQVYSLGSRKVKKVTVTTDAIFTEDIMKDIPATEEELSEFRRTVRTTRDVFGIWVSRDEKAALFTATFIAERVDYDELFEKVQQIVERESDDKHVIYAAGEPILTGLVYSYQQEMLLIFGVTFASLFLLLYFYFRNVVGVVVPVLSTIVGGIWGLGFCGLVGYNLEPLTLVIPLLITARAIESFGADNGAVF